MTAKGKERIDRKNSIEKKIDNKIKNNYGFVVNTRKDRYCKLIGKGIYGKNEILSIVKKEFGTASPNAFSFFLRDLRLKKIKVNRTSILSFNKD